MLGGVGGLVYAWVAADSELGGLRVSGVSAGLVRVGG